MTSTGKRSLGHVGHRWRKLRAQVLDALAMVTCWTAIGINVGRDRIVAQGDCQQVGGEYPFGAVVRRWPR